MHSQVIRAHRAAVLIVCAAIAAACNSSPVDVDSNSELAPAASEAAESARFSVTPLHFDFGSTRTEIDVTLTNSSSTGLSWTVREGAGWLVLSPTSGRIAARSSKTLRVEVDRAEKTAGSYSTSVLLSAGSAGSAEIPVSMEVAPGFSISLSPIAVDLESTETSATVTLTNNSSTGLNWTAQEGAGWLVLSSTSGRIAARSSKTLRFEVNRDEKTAGSYSTSVLISAGSAGSTQLPVSMIVASRSPVSLFPVDVDLESNETSATVTLTNNSSTGLNWTAQEGAGWLVLSPTSGRIAARSSKTLRVEVERAEKTAGSYSTSVLISAGSAGSTELPVSMTVASRSPLPPPPPPPSPSSGGSSVNVRDFGARGDGQSNDSPAFDAALNALPSSGGTVVVPAGTYLLEPMFLSPIRPLTLTRKHNVSFTGEGMDRTVLKMVNGHYDTGVLMLLIQESSGILIKDLTFDMNRDGSYYGDEQSHIFRVLSSSDLTFSGVRFMNSPGDGIYFLGIAALGDPWVDGVTIENCRFFNLWRNGITIQRGVRNLGITGNTFERVSQQSISSEPSGFDGAARDVVIENNVIRHFSGSYSIALAGNGSRDPIKGLTFRNNRVDNGAVYFLWVEGIQVIGNTLSGGPTHAALRLQDITGGVVANNSITGTDSRATAVFQLVNDGRGLSRDVQIRDNRVDARVGRTGIHVKDALAQITVTGNEVIGPGSARGIVVETLVTGIGLRNGFTVTNNDIRNFRHSIAFVARGDRFSNVRIDSNRMNHDQQPTTETIGIVLDRTGPVTTIAQLLANMFGEGIKTPFRVLGG